MSDPIEPPDGKEILVDGVDDIHILENVCRCTFFARQRSGGEPRRVEAVRLAIPVAELPEIIQQFVIALTQAARTTTKSMLS